MEYRSTLGRHFFRVRMRTYELNLDSEHPIIETFAKLFLYCIMIQHENLHCKFWRSQDIWDNQTTPVDCPLPGTESKCSKCPGNLRSSGKIKRTIVLWGLQPVNQIQKCASCLIFINCLQFNAKFKNTELERILTHLRT